MDGDAPRGRVPDARALAIAFLFGGAIIQAVAIGIGFMGSGVVQASKQEERGEGLTTAASLWTTAAVGIAARFRRDLLGAELTILVLVATRLLGWLEQRRTRRARG